MTSVLESTSVPLIHSADGHVWEPDDLFQTRLPKHLRVSASRRECFERDGRYFSSTYLAMKAGQEADYFITAERIPDPDGTVLDADPARRLAALDADGVGYEVLNPGSFGMYWTPDAELAMAHARVQNDWMAETYLPITRFIPTAAIPLVDVAMSVAEIERVAALGFKAFVLPIFRTPFYWSAEYEPLWAAARDTGMIPAFHVALGFDELGYGMLRQIGPLPDPSRGGNQVVAERCYSAVEYSLPAQRLIAALVGGGVCDRYPELTFVIAESNAHWLAGLMGAMDKAYTLGAGQADKALVGRWDDNFDVDHQPMMTNLFADNERWPYDLRPSEYVKRQIKLTFMDDPVAIACRNITGVETLLWASDYPHPEATSPRSREVVDALFRGVSDEDRAAITGGNLAKLFGLDLEAV
jgi:predicted TIM-barrel fold metal-dependent hydrolase